MSSADPTTPPTTINHHLINFVFAYGNQLALAINENQLTSDRSLEPGLRLALRLLSETLNQQLQDLP